MVKPTSGPRGLVALALALAACSRTPPEPAPAATTSTPSVTSAAAAGSPGAAVAQPGVAPVPASASPANPTPSALAGRCIAAMAATPPPIPASASHPACPADPEPDHKMPLAKVAFPDAPGTPRVDVELARNEHDVQRGLMYRTSMPEERGMLFKLSERTDHTFWMHNTCIPLDMLFVDDDGVIVGIVEAARPLDDSTRSVGCPSSWVLEVNAGWCRRHGVKPGQKLGIPAAAR